MSFESINKEREKAWYQSFKFGEDGEIVSIQGKTPSSPTTMKRERISQKVKAIGTLYDSLFSCVAF